jgi:hypothetical protein
MSGRCGSTGTATRSRYSSTATRAGAVERYRQIYRDYRARVESLLFDSPED